MIHRFGSLFALFVLAAACVIAMTPASFADHSEVIIETATGFGESDCEKTAEGCYIPSTATVDVGGVVIFSNIDSTSHTFTSGDPTMPKTVRALFASGLVSTGSTYEWSPTESGNVPYFCLVHPWMEGLIIVQEAHRDKVEELMVKITPAEVLGGTQVELEFSELHVNYEITAMQNGEEIFSETVHAMENIANHHIDAVGSDHSPIDIDIVSLGIGPPDAEADWTGPTGSIATLQVVPEFDTIAMMILAVAIAGIIAVTVKSRLASNGTCIGGGGKVTMSNNIYKLTLVGILAIIVFGGYMAISGYNTDIYPLDRIRGNLDGIVSSSDPDIIRDHLMEIQADLDTVMVHLPETTDESGKVVAKNPVWIFATESTNFLRIQNNIDTMFAGVDEISSVSKDNSAYHTGMLDINDRAALLKTNVMDATPYMYVSPANMMFSAIWIAAVIGIFAILKRKKEQLQKSDETGV